MKSHDEHMDLVGRYLSGQATDEEVAQLEALMLDDPHLRADFLAYARVDAALPGAIGEKAALVEFAPSAGAKSRWWPWASVAAAAAAILLIALGSLIWPGRDKPVGPEGGEVVQKGEPTDDGVAVLVDAGDVEWLDGDPPQESDILSPGPLRLKSGLLQLEFYSGARLIVEGPADLEIVSADEVICRQGRGRAVVPPPAHGFRVVAPQFELIDLGTEFGVAVDPNGEARVQVFDGEVELIPPGGKRSAATTEKLTRGEGRAWTAEGKRVSRKEEPGDFPTFEELQRRKAKVAERRFARWQEWKENIAGDPRVAFRFDFDSQGLELLDRGPTASHGTIIGAEWTTGRISANKALEFKRPGDRVRLDLPGTYDALTLMAWVRVDSLPDRPQALLLTDGYEVGRVHWQLNQDGNLRLGVRKPAEKLKDGATGYGSPVLITPRRVGAWSFLATVYDRASGTVRHYFNGREVSSDEIVYDQPLQFGACDLGNWTPSSMKTRRPVRNFVGRVDELTVWKAALTAKEIRAIYLKTRT